MSGAEILIIAFTVSNSLRIIAYIPQIRAIGRSRDGARSISLLTWCLFASSHLTAVAYAIVVVADLKMAAIFFANALGCATIIALTLDKRRRYGAAVSLSAKHSTPQVYRMRDRLVHEVESR